jgi:OOP family OmpA-OmpF porin
MRVSRLVSGLGGAAAMLFVGAPPTQATDIDDMRAVDASGQSPFLQALTDEYRQFVVFEADEMYDWIDAGYFARKGLATARGEVVLPEELAGWDLPATHIDDMSQGRERLMRTLDSGARESKPQLAAHAQGSFDCWVEQQEENHQPDDIAACRGEFLEAMAELEKQPEPAPAPAPAAMAPSTYLVLFDWNTAAITPAGQAVVTQALADAREADTVNMSTIGHADRSGGEEYNLTLSLARADAVRQALIDGGTAADTITAVGRGEAEPAIPTPDGVREEANRRVEIILQ